MTTFVGEDRRRAVREPRLSHVALAGIMAMAVTALAVPTTGQPEVGAALDTVTALAAVAVFVLCRARSRLFGETGPLWTGAAVFTAGLGVALAPHVRVHRVGDAAVLAGLLLLAAGMVAPTVDTRVRPLRLVALGVASTLVATPIAWKGAGVVGCLVVAAPGLGRKRRNGWGVFALVVATAALGAGTSGLKAQASYAVGFAGVVICCALELGRGYVDQRSRLFGAEVSLQTREVGERLRAESRSTQRHDVRNAVVAVEGAALVLESHVDRLTAEDRAELTKVLSSGVERLQRLLREEGPERVDLGVVARDVAVGRTGITVDVPAGLIATGSAVHTAEVLRALLDNAERRAPGQPVRIEGRREGDWMVLQVRDRGAPVGREERRSLASADIGFIVASRLMRDQSGDVWVESHPEGGAFSLCLPCASSL